MLQPTPKEPGGLDDELWVSSVLVGGSDSLGPINPPACWRSISIETKIPPVQSLGGLRREIVPPMVKHHIFLQKINWPGPAEFRLGKTQSIERRVGDQAHSCGSGSIGQSDSFAGPQISGTRRVISQTSSTRMYGHQEIYLNIAGS